MVSMGKVWADLELPWEELSAEQGWAEPLEGAVSLCLLPHPNPFSSCLWILGDSGVLCCVLNAD